jgi:hypothetical protein
MMSRRLELKYLVDRTTRTSLEQDLAALMDPDPYAGPDGSYLVRSLYFDTPDYLAYHDKLAGAARRNKLRIRAYGAEPAEASHVRLEVKSRYLDFIHKITVDLPVEEYAEVEQSLFRRTQPPARLLEDDRVSKEFFRIQKQFNMEPKTLIQYRRQAFERRELCRVRANFDDELLASRQLELLSPLQGARRLLQYGHAVFEIKVDGAMPFWMHRLISKYDLQNQAVSKYCYAVRSEGRFTAASRCGQFV